MLRAAHPLGALRGTRRAQCFLVVIATQEAGIVRAASLRRYAVGAEPTVTGVDFRVWAPACRSIDVVRLRGDAFATFAMTRQADGYFQLCSPEFQAGDLYAYRADGAPEMLVDPASRFQPWGVHGPSQVVDASTYAWSDAEWRGVGRAGQVIYELHVGTFTPEGTYVAAIAQLPALRDLGVTVIELMPLAEFPGRFGWGYDGVLPWAPSAGYGSPDDLRRFVDAAHGLGIGVILDVVYNHCGPCGSPLARFSPHYLSTRHQGEWGDCFNLDGEYAAPVREFFVESAACWIDEFHLDGFRLDAIQAVLDDSPRHLVADLIARARSAAPGRRLWVVAEDNPQRAWVTRSIAAGGWNVDALWNDDFHHAAVVALTGRREAYYSDFSGSPQELISATRWGFLYQGQGSAWEQKSRGTPALYLEGCRWVTFLENHDQVANSGLGTRLAQRASPARLRAVTALWLLGPGTPMFFQGQEFGSSAPFVFFADHEVELAALVRTGRQKFMSQFPSLGTAEVEARIPDPADPSTFARCKLDHRQRETNRALWTLHRDLLRLRREDPAFAAQRAEQLFGAVLSPEAFVVRFRCDRGDRLLLVNLGTDLHLEVTAEPLLASPCGTGWHVAWSSEAVAYGGSGTPPLDGDLTGWCLPGCSAIVLRDRNEDGP